MYNLKKIFWFEDIEGCTNFYLDIKVFFVLIYNCQSCSTLTCSPLTLKLCVQNRWEILSKTLKITQIYVCGPAAQTSIYLWSFKPHYFHIFPFRNKISTYFQSQYPTLWWSWCRVTCLYCRRWDRRSPNMILHIINISTIRRLSMPMKICGRSYMEI